MNIQRTQLSPKPVQALGLPFHDEENPTIAISRTDVSATRPSIPRKPVGSQPSKCQQPTTSIHRVEHDKLPRRSNRSVHRDHFPETHARRAHLFKCWWLETAACLLFLAALVAIFATLYPHQGKPLPEWPYQLSVNTLLSIYVVVMKGTILLVTAEGLGQLKWKWMQEKRPLQDLVTYVEATRGPLGALKLLWRLHLRHPLTSAGALVTLLILAIDPFTQQMIHYYNCIVPMDGLQATMPRTNMFIQRQDWDSGNVSTTGLVEPGLREAVNNGVVSPNGRVVAYCPTGNCTFEQEYGTVTYCSSCTDVTKDLTLRSSFVKSNHTGFSMAPLVNPNGTNTTVKIDDVWIARNTNISISMSLPSGFTISANPGTTFNLTAMQVLQPSQHDGGYRVEIIVGKQFQVFDPMTGNPPKGCDTRDANDTWYCRGFGAASCSLSPCVHSYTSAIEAGELKETRVSSSGSTSSSWGSFVPPPSGPTGPGGVIVEIPATAIYQPYLGIVDTLCLSAYERQSLIDTGYQLDARARWLAYNLTFDPQSENISSNASFPQSMMFNKCIYAINNLLVYDLWDFYLTNFFKGSVEGDAGDSGGPQSGTIQILNGSQILQSMYNYGNVSFDRVNETFRNISDSMTAYLRQHSIPKYSDPAKGLVMHDQTCLSVRWAWLASPSALVILTIIFFLAMIIDTRPTGGRIPVWKSSPLPLFFHGLASPSRAPKVTNDLDGMEEAAKYTIVKLGATGQDLNFVVTAREHTKGK